MNRFGMVKLSSALFLGDGGGRQGNKVPMAIRCCADKDWTLYGLLIFYATMDALYEECTQPLVIKYRIIVDEVLGVCLVRGFRKIVGCPITNVGHDGLGMDA
jgi:hypothetical protein